MIDLKFTESLIKKPTKNSETSEIMDLLVDGYSYEAELKVDEIITKLKENKHRQGFELGLFREKSC